MSTSELYVAAAESTNPNDTWWFLGFLPILLLVAFWIAAVISIIASAHRGDAFRAAEACANRVKAEVPIWKEQSHGDGSVNWVGLE